MFSGKPTTRPPRQGTFFALLALGLAVAVALSMVLVVDDADANTLGKKKRHHHAKPLRSELIPLFADVTAQPAQRSVPANGAIIADFSFTPETVSFLGPNALIASATITKATIFDGNSEPGEIDENDLFLALDGINTGLPVRGFPADSTVSKNVGGAITNGSGPAILAALKADNTLTASIIDVDPEDGNTVSLPPDPVAFAIGAFKTPPTTIKHKKKRTLGKRRHH